MRGLSRGHKIWLTAGLLLAVLIGLNIRVANGQAMLPACSAEVGLDVVFPSPQFQQDSTLFWINQRTLFRSLDSGQTWLQVFQTTSDPFAIDIEQFQIVPHVSDPGLSVFMGVHNFSFARYPFYHSDDTGDTWQERTQACSPREWADCARFSLRAAGQTPVLFQPRWWFYYGSPLPFGIARSLDSGQSWHMVWEETNAGVVAVSPDYDNDHTVWAALIEYSPSLGDDFILSHDGGETWQAAGQGLCDVSAQFAHLQVSPGYAQDRTLLMSFYKNSLFRSTDGGLTWQAIFPRNSTPICDYSSTVLRDLNPRFAPNYPDDPTIYVATNEGLYVSYDDGHSWRRLTVSGTVFSLEVAAQAAGLTPDERPAGVAMSQVNVPTTTHRLFLPRVAAPGTPTPTRPYTLFMSAYVEGTYNAYMYRSDDGGVTWECMERPQVRRRAYLPLLHMRED